MKTLIDFESFHKELDAVTFGFIASNPETDELLRLDGAAVVFASTEVIPAWLHEHNRQDFTDWHPAPYGWVINVITEDNFSFHMDATTAKGFLELYGMDHRFYPEVLHFESDGWTTVSSSFDELADSPADLKREIDRYVVGSIVDDQIRGKRHNSCKSTALTYADYERLKVPASALCECAAPRLKSLQPWIKIWESIADL